MRMSEGPANLCMVRRAALGFACMVLSMFTVAGCGDSTSITVRCTAPGGEAECTCSDGTSGTKVCDANDDFGPCSCEGVGAGGAIGAGGFGTTGGSSSSGGFGGSGAISGSGGAIASGGSSADAGTLHGKKGVTLASGQDSLVDVFATTSGIVVISESSISLVDRTGKVMQSKASPRQITAAAFDGATLAVFDKAFLQTYSLALTAGAQVSLSEPCASAAFVSGSRVVCGNASDTSHAFYVFDASAGKLLNGMSGDVTSPYQGVPMRTVPGKDDFITAPTEISPPNFYLHRVDSSSSVSLLAPTPFFDEFAISMVFAFEGNPADHLVTEEGVRLLLYGSECTANAPSGAVCFAKDGSLGTLRDTERFIGMDGDGTKIYGLVDTQPAQYVATHCSTGCSVQRIDTQSRTIDTQTTYDVEAGQIIATRFDATSNALVVGYANPGTVSAGTSLGYRVELLAY